LRWRVASALMRFAVLTMDSGSDPLAGVTLMFAVLSR
jgi:hypothetical protein